ncbi:MAG TPA: glycosyltransferase family 4 protein [Chitinophagaceae bacterium]|nr:glycosyltransferase family 4 protein [Chitinophagaceae bacterium]
MRVALIARTTLHTVPGGDTVQVLATAKYLRQLGVEADVRLTHETIDYNSYDLLHFFNIIRPADILKHIRPNKPYVVSTIFVDYTGYDKKGRKGWRGALFRLLSPGMIEYVKVLARYCTRKDGIASREYVWLGHDRAVKKILRRAACLLPNSESEYRRLEKAYGIPKKYYVVPNGIDPEIFQPRPQIPRKNDMVICMARIEGIKNQLNLILALNNTAFRLYLIGNPAPNQPGYYAECKKAAASNIHFIDNLPQSSLVKCYSQAKVHVLPSWFETTGLSSLEAAAMGCNVVIGDRGDAKEYFGDMAFYCDPASPESIRTAIQAAAAADTHPDLQCIINSKFTWRQAAFATVEAYKAIV